MKLTGPTGMRRTRYRLPVESDVVSRPDAPPNVTVTRAPAIGPPVALFVIRPDRTYVRGDRGGGKRDAVLPSVIGERCSESARPVARELTRSLSR